MTSGPIAPQRAHSSDHSLAVYLAPLIEGRRVAVVGPKSGDVARRCRALGAATVISFGGEGEGIAVRPLTDGAIASFQGRLDAILIPDATAVALASVLDEARRALGKDGFVAVVSRPSDAAVTSSGSDTHGPSYYELHDALAARFATVQMLGRGPFAAYTFATLGGSHQGVTLDTRLIPEAPSAAEAFVAVGCDVDLALDAVSLVQVPVGEMFEVQKPAAADGARSEALEAKLQAAESVAAERSVRVQRLEHEAKALDDEARNGRDRAAKLARELDDERKARQRAELEAQVARRGSELPRSDGDDLRLARERNVQVERDLAETRTHAETSARQVAELRRELDEVHEAEAELRVQLDAALAAPKRGADDAAEFARIEQELFVRANEVIDLRGRVDARDAAVRELTYALEAATDGALGAQVQQARERVAELSALNAGLAMEASSIVKHNELLTERVAHLDGELLERANELQLSQDGANAARAELEGVRANVLGIERALADEISRAADSERQLTDARADLSRNLAVLASLEDRSGQTDLELEGARAGYAHRVRELEAEVEQLVRALEVVGTHSSDEDERLDALMRDLETMRAEKNGVLFRLRDAESALASRPALAMTQPPATIASHALSDASDDSSRVEQLLEDLSATAARVADLEEALQRAREAAMIAENRADDLSRRVDVSRFEAGPTLENRASSGGAADDGDDLRREAAERELLVRSLVAQLEDRDLRLRAMERRLVEDVERARRTESEIWEVELRARDQRIGTLSRDLDRVRTTEGPAGGANGGDDAQQLTTLRQTLAGRDREIRELRTSIEQVRAGLSSILVDGRGAVVAHDLVTLLRQIEDSQTPD